MAEESNISPITRAAIAHRTNVGLRYVDVPEWAVDGKPTRVHWYLMTLNERRDLLAEGMTDADTVIRKALNEHGQPLFTMFDRPALMGHVDTRIVQRLSTYMHGLAEPPVTEKN